MNKIQAIRGMNDILPDQTPQWQFLEQCARTLLASYAYQEIRFPVLEQTQLFKRSIGEVTDIVEKEMYTFEDRNGDSLTLRPEGTACCVRAAEQHGLLYNQIQKLWYMGPMYRHERPQKGRYRQFNQLGVEAFGLAGADIEAELLMMTARLWRDLDIAEHLELQINNLGASADRVAYGKALTDFLLPLKTELDEDSQRRLGSNVLRILDSKSPATQALLENAPQLDEFISEDSRANFTALLEMLDQAGIKYSINPRLVRGLDYYNGLVFEWVTDKLGAQATVCAGGRYDGLSRQLGGTNTPGIGFAMGLERLLLMLTELNKLPEHTQQYADVFIAVIGNNIQGQALAIAEQVRSALPGLRVLTHCGGGKYNSQLKKAYASTASCALILEGTTELKEVRFKRLDDEGLTDNIAVTAIPETLATFFDRAI